MRILITGGAGFIGANLVRHWVEAHPDDEVVVLDALTYAGHRTSIRDLEESRKIEFIHGDIRVPADVRRAVEGADVIAHLAAESHVDRSIADPAPFFSTNVLGTYTLLEASRTVADGVRFHHVSTDEVFGSLPLDDPSRRFTEATPYAPRSPYAASKAASDHLVRSYFHTYGLPATVSNCGNNYGPFQDPEKLIPLAIARLLQGGRVPLYGSGTNVRDWIHVSDHCRALDAIVRHGRAGATYLVGADGEMSNSEVVERLVHLLGRERSAIEHVADRPGHDARYAIDSRATRTALRWTPTVGFEEGLASTVRWYQEHRGWWEPILAERRGNGAHSGPMLSGRGQRTENS
ncbi:MAG TPA: dTDP-glucose 4,6-dehydratase [Thermoplasmata archaeon]|nr:dTDP-glucose 4,6-dehydratase [Thermoplasmata archaeon]